MKVGLFNSMLRCDRKRRIKARNYVRMEKDVSRELLKVAGVPCSREVNLNLT